MKNEDKENLQIFSLIWLFMEKLYIYIVEALLSFHRK